jgi:hypothetical protein
MTLRQLEIVRNAAGYTCLMSDDEPLPTMEAGHPLIGWAALVLTGLMVVSVWLN